MAKTVEEQLEKQIRGDQPLPLPEHLVCTFEGSYFKGGQRGLDSAHFTETVKVPVSWCHDEEKSPQGVFRLFYAGKLVAKNPGYSGIRTVHLVKSEGLPLDMKISQRLRWTADYQELVEIASRYTKEVRCELWPHADSLRHAIQRAMADPEAFAKDQAKHSGKKFHDSKRMEEELRALGY